MKMIFATDVDGTILTDKGIPHEETNSAFKYARMNDNNIVIATGRSLARTNILLEMMPDVNYLICNNGTLIKDIEKDEVIFLNHISPKHYLEMFNFAKKNNFSFAMHTNINTYMWPIKRYSNCVFLSSDLHQNISKYIISNPDIESLESGEFITQLSLFGNEEECEKNFPLIQKIFKNIQSVFLTNGNFIDVNPLGISKWTGLKFLANYLNIDLKKIVTFGDSGNDLEMLQNAGKYGFPMKNSTPDLTKILQSKIGDNNSNAIAKKIIELVDSK